MKALRQAVFDRRELSGSLGDLGTFLPLLVAMVAQNGLDFTSALFFAGVFNLVTGFTFSIPMAVQPMKAIAAVALVQGLSPPQIAAAGLWVSLAVLALTATGWLERLYRALPEGVLRGLQLGLGLSLLGKGLALVVSLGSWWVLDGYALALLALLLTLGLDSRRGGSAALVLFVVGCCLAFWIKPVQLQPGLYLPVFRPLSWEDLTIGFWSAALPQLPLTLLNSVIAVSLLSYDLFPERGASVRKVALSVGIMNLVPAFFGGMPMCHGSGGLAGQVRFGARSNGSILMLGLCKVLLALFLGSSLLQLCQAFPSGILGVMLAFSGLELSLLAYRQFKPAETAALLVTAGAILGLANPALGMGLGWTFWKLQGLSRRG